MTDPAPAVTSWSPVFGRDLIEEPSTAVSAAVASLRSALAAIDAGEVTATALEHAYLSGAADALESLFA